MTFAGKVHDVSDIRQAGNTKVCTVRIYQSYPKKKSDDGSVSEWGSDWVSVTAFGAAAEVCQTLEKKQEIIVEGRLKYDTWENKQGDKRSELKINASFIHRPNGSGQATQKLPATDEPLF